MQKVKSHWDVAGATVSLLCALHCAALPFAIGVLPLIGLSFIADEWFEWALTGAAALLGLFSLCLGFWRHRVRGALIILSIALTALLTGRLSEHWESETVGLPLMVAGGLLMALAHGINFRLCHACVTCQMTNEESDKLNSDKPREATWQSATQKAMQKAMQQAMQRPQQLMQFQNVALGYGTRLVVDNVSFSIYSGDYLAIVGANGAGKTTLLRGLLGLLAPQNGQVERALQLRYGYVPQLQTVEELFPVTVLDVVLMGRYGQIGVLKRPSVADRNRALEALNETGIAEHAEKLYRDLSGGQKQRTLIARALVSDPQVLVLDEHTSDLDIVAERAIMSLIDELHARHRMAVVMVSHSLNTVANHAREIGIINNGTFTKAPVEDVLQAEFLEKLYGVPLRVAEVEGVKVVL